MRDVARLPGRLVGAAEIAIDRLPALERSVRDIAFLLPGVAQRVAAIEETAARLDARVAELQAALSGLEGVVRGAVDRLPDPDAPGPLARAKDALTG